MESRHPGGTLAVCDLVPNRLATDQASWRGNLCRSNQRLVIDVQVVRAVVSRHPHLRDHRVEVVGDAIVVFERTDEFFDLV